MDYWYRRDTEKSRDSASTHTVPSDKNEKKRWILKVGLRTLQMVLAFIFIGIFAFLIVRDEEEQYIIVTPTDIALCAIAVVSCAILLVCSGLTVSRKGRPVYLFVLDSFLLICWICAVALLFSLDRLSQCSEYLQSGSAHPSSFMSTVTSEACQLWITAVSCGCILLTLILIYMFFDVYFRWKHDND